MRVHGVRQMTKHIALLVLFLGGLMAYELLHTVWGYQQSNKPSTPLVNWVADLAGMKPAQ